MKTELLLLLRSYVTGGNLNDKYKFTEKERDTETNYDYFGARYYDSELGIWRSVDPLTDMYPGWSPYNYTLNNPLRFTDPNGLTVVFMNGISDPILDENGNPKSVDQMTKEEKSRYYFQQWWAQNGQEVLYWFGPDGKYASTEIRFYPGMAPDKGSPGGVKNSMRKTYSGLTTFGEKGWSQKEMYYGETKVAISELPKLEKTQINVYVNLKYAQTNTAEHEWKHVKIIFNCVQDQKPVPSGGNSDGSEPNTQHWLINNGKVPSFK